MTTATEVEVTAVHAPGAELVPHGSTGTQPEEYRPRILMQPEEAKALATSLEDNMRAVLKEDVDFGVIPGTGTKPSLLKPGAEKLLQWFGFGHVNERAEIERDGDGNRIGVTYRCRVTKGMPDGRTVTVATCEGYAGYDEDRFYVSEADARAKAEKNERKWAAQDGRAPKPAKWEHATEYRAPWNSVIKMAQKRALVGAALAATSASTLFTQDVEDMAPAVPEPAGPKFGDVAMDALKALDRPVLEAVGKWYRGKGWPDPREWDAAQWCTALQAAGFIAGQRAVQAAATPVARDADPAERAFAEAPPSLAAAARLDPDDDWALRLDEIGDDEGAARTVLIDLARSTVDAAKGHRIRTAVVTAFPALAGLDDQETAA
jgi:hypothetical protein